MLVRVVQVFGIMATFFALCIAKGGLFGVTAAGLMCGANGVSLNLLLRLIRREG